MANSASHSFAHRHTPNGGIESICMTCFLTIARSQSLEEAQASESQHVCQPDPLPLAFHFQDA
jgi:hypothetical protein